jgi:hypothetical protein
MILVVAWGIWSLVLSMVLDRRFGRWALRRADQGVAATARMVRRSQVCWLALWFVVWVVSVVLTDAGRTSRDAALVVVPMVLVYGPLGMWLATGRADDLVERGADPDVARAIFRAGSMMALVGVLLCSLALALTFIP